MLFCWFCQEIVTSRPYRFSVSDNRNISRLTPNKVKYCIQTYTRETCRGFGAPLCRDSTHLREALRKEDQLSSAHQTRNSERSLEMGACFLGAQPEQLDIITTSDGWEKGIVPRPQWCTGSGQVLGLRLGQGRAGGTGTGIKQLSLLRMWRRMHGHTTPQVGC